MSAKAPEAEPCFWCEEIENYHPTCDYPGCENEKHGQGKIVGVFCADCREEL